MILEALIPLARLVVTAGARTWLTRRQQADERSRPLAELIKRETPDVLVRRRSERDVERMVDSVAARLQPLVGRLPDNEARAAIDAVADTVRAADLSDRMVFAVDVEPVALARRLREVAPDRPARAGLSEPATRLYETVLDECCVCFTQLVIQAKPFTGRGIAETLGRLSDIAGKVDEVLTRLPVRPLTDDADDFLNRYLEHLSGTLDDLELYGVDVRRYRPRTTLSVAYVSLSVSARTARQPAGPGRWAPGSLRGLMDGGLMDGGPDLRGGPDTGSLRVEQALCESDRTLIRGEAGSGKTTILRWLAVTAARSRFGASAGPPGDPPGSLAEWNGCVPFLVKLRRHAGGRLPEPERFLTGVADPITGLMPAGWVHRQLDSGRSLVLVDGVDELPAGERGQVRAWLRQLLAAYPSIKVVVTSRPAAAADRWLAAEGFSTANLERMTPADVRSLVRQWHEAVRDAGGLPCAEQELPRYENALLSRLDANPHLQMLATSPLMCAMLCALNLDRATQLPADRMGVYQAAVDLLLERRDAERSIRGTVPELDGRDKLHLLQYLAWRLSVNGRTEIARSDAARRLGERLAGMPQVRASGEAVLDHLTQRSGILREPAADRVDFVHRTFQEYLTAREAAEQGDNGLLVDRAHLDSWRETIIMAAGHGNAPLRRSLLAGILDRADREPAHCRALTLLAAACLETVPAVDPPELLARMEQGLDRLLPPRSWKEARSLAAVGEPLLRRIPATLDGISEARAAALVSTIALVNGPPALDVLAGYAPDPRPAVQQELARVWGYFDPHEYAARVLADAPLNNGRIEVDNPLLLPAVHHLTRLSSLSVDMLLRSRFDVRLLAGVPALRRLFLPLDAPMEDPDLSWLAEHLELESLILDIRTAEYDLALLTRLPRLNSLDIGLPHGRDVGRLSELTGLTHLGLRHSSAGELDWELGILADLRALTSLGVSGWRRLRLDLLGALPDLHYLGLRRSGDPGGGLGALADALPGLEFLDLSGCRWLADLAPVARLTALVFLDISRTAVTDVSAVAALRKLRTLRLGNCNRIDELAEVASLPHFSELYLGGTDVDVDLSPFAGRRLTITLGQGARVTGLDRLGRGVKIRDYRG